VSIRSRLRVNKKAKNFRKRRFIMKTNIHIYRVYTKISYSVNIMLVLIFLI